MSYSNNNREYYLFLPRSFHTEGNLYDMVKNYLFSNFKVQIDQDQISAEGNDWINIVVPKGFNKKKFEEEIEKNIVNNPLFQSINGIQDISLKKRDRNQEKIDQTVKALIDLLQSNQFQSRDIIKKQLPEIEKKIKILGKIVK